MAGRGARAAARARRPAADAERGARPSTRPSRGRRSARAGARARTCGRGRGRQVADLLAAARRLELRLLRELGAGLRGDAASRAARELLAVQASDWAFLDSRGQAGDYPFERVLDHSRALFEAIDSSGATEPRLRNLAPDLDLAPLLEP